MDVEIVIYQESRLSCSSGLMRNLELWTKETTKRDEQTRTDTRTDARMDRREAWNSDVDFYHTFSKNHLTCNYTIPMLLYSLPCKGVLKAITWAWQAVSQWARRWLGGSSTNQQGRHKVEWLCAITNDGSTTSLLNSYPIMTTATGVKAKHVWII